MVATNKRAKKDQENKIEEEKSEQIKILENPKKNFYSINTQKTFIFDDEKKEQ